jgi:hypothetical protein
VWSRDRARACVACGLRIDCSTAACSSLAGGRAVATQQRQHEPPAAHAPAHTRSHTPRTLALARASAPATNTRPRAHHQARGTWPRRRSCAGPRATSGT